MQQRRGTASQWTSANPILNAGEIGFESDTNKFKIGDGTNHWADLGYFVDADTLIDGAPGLLDTLNELAAAIGDDPSFFTTVATNLSNHQADTTNVHGIADTAELATKAFAASLLTGATKSNITITGDKNGLTITAENGVSDSNTDNLVEGSTNKYFTNERAQDAVADAIAAGTHSNITITYDDQNNKFNFAAENGVADSTTDNLTEGSTNKYFTDERAQDAVGNSVGTGLSYNDSTGAISVDTATIQARVADVSDTEIGYLNGVTSGVQSQLDDKAPLASPTFTGTVSGITATMVGLGNVDNTSDANKPVSTATQTALDLKAPLASPTFTGTTTTDDLIVDGDFTVNGTNFAASATSITIEDNLVQLAHQNPANTVDLGIVVGYTESSTAKHSGLVRDVSTDKWKLFKGVTTEPTTTVDFTQGSLDDLELAGLTVSSLAVGSVTNTEIGYLSGVTSAIQTQLDDKVDAAYVDGAVSNAEVDQSTLAGSGITWNVATSQFDVNTTTIQARVADVSDTEIGYLNGVTSAIQTQINSKSPTAGNTSLVTLGTVTTGTWNATTIATTKGGTGLTGFTAGDMIYASATDTLAKLAKGTANQVMYMNSAGTAPEWRTAAAGAAFSELMLVGC